VPDCNFIIHIARVEVDEASGKTKVIAVKTVSDVGVIGNYLAVEGQAYGGLMHSIGYALSEDYYDEDKKYATPLGCGFPRCNDVPDDMVFEFIENPRKEGPFGSGGASECFQACGHAAVLNAIYNAVGVRIHEIPATPDKVKAALAAKAKGESYEPKTYYLGEDFNDVLEDIKANPVASPKPPVVTKEEILTAGH